MSSLTTRPQVFGQDLFVAQAVPQSHKLGEQGITADGRKFRYVSVEPSASTVTGQTAGATLVAGNVIACTPQIANHLAMTPTAAAIGATQILATLGATAAYANQYSEGYALISTTPGNGIAYGVAGHALVASAGVITLNLTDSVLVALTSSSRVDLQQNIYKGVIQAPVTTATAVAVGVAPWALPALTTGGATGQNFGWVQTYGVCACLITGTPAVGAMVAATGAAAGAAAIASSTLQVIGSMISTGVSGKNNAVFLTID